MFQPEHIGLTDMLDLNTLPKTRKEALKIGSNFYFIGKPCKNGHVSERYTKNGTCIKCQKESSKKRRQTDAFKEYQREYMKHHRQTDAYKEYQKKYRQTDAFKESQREYNKKYSQTDAYKESINKYQKNNITYVVTRGVLHRLLNRKATGLKVHQVDEILGYSASQLREHLKAQFTEGMSWDNWGEWHIDHIKPVAQFKREGITDPKIINALSNLQPLWAEENLKKSDKTLNEDF